MSQFGSVVPTARELSKDEITLSAVITTEITTGELISDGKVDISGCLEIENSALFLTELVFSEQDTNAGGDLEKPDCDIYIFRNTDALDATGSGVTFSLDGTTPNTKVLYQGQIKTGGDAIWIDSDPNNSRAHLKDINVRCWADDVDSRSLGFAIVARGSATYVTHTLTLQPKFDLMDLKNP